MVVALLTFAIEHIPFVGEKKRGSSPLIHVFVSRYLYPCFKEMLKFGGGRVDSPRFGTKASKRIVLRVRNIVVIKYKVLSRTNSYFTNFAYDFICLDLSLLFKILEMQNSTNSLVQQQNKYNNKK